jgi:putative endopeptidase
MKRFSRRSLVAAMLALCSGSTFAALDVEGLDRAIDPCADFYQYANKRWIDSTPIPDDQPRWGAFDSLVERNMRALIAALDYARSQPNPPRGSPQRKAIDFYASGMDREAIAKAGLKPLEPALERIAAVRDVAGLSSALAYLQARGADAGFAFVVRPDSKNSSRYLAEIAQAGLGLPERDYYFLEDERTRRIRAEYRKHVARLFALAGDEAALAARNAATVVDLETQLARASMTAVQRRDVEKTYNKTAVATLAREAPGFPWAQHFAALGAGELSELNVAQPDFFKAFARLAAERDPAQWRTYLRWHLLHAAANKLPEAFDRSHFEFYEGVLRGRRAQPPRSRYVVEIIGGRTGSEPMGQALGMVFVDATSAGETKERVAAMIANIKAALAERLGAVEWMEDDTRRKSLEKLAAMRVKIAYPDQWRDYADADVGPFLFAENWMRAKAFVLRRDVARIGQAVNRDEWFMSPHIVNAFYNARGNEIVFPAGILQPPFFDVKADDAVNYGGIGAVIGHEITHGFDDNGRRFDAIGNLTDWWTPGDARRYVERAQRVERQYANYSGVDDLKVNGKLTLGENISDVGGLKIAYLALEKALHDHPEAAIEGFSPEQRFFLSFAQIWRSHYRPEMERLMIRTDAHSPPRFRVAGVVTNLPEFAQAFSCDASKALLSDADRANIW